MFKRLLSAVTSTAVVAGLVTAGVVATAAPAAAATGGTLRVTKAFDPKTSGASTSFKITYSCDNGGPSSGETSVTAGSFVDIPVSSPNAGNMVCTVSEPSPTAPAGWGFFLPVFGGANQQSPTPFVGQVTFTSTSQTRTLDLANQITDSVSNTYNGQTVTAATNPAIPESCGIDLTLVLDASLSIDNAGAKPDVRKAANAILKALRDTNSTARITQFSTGTQQLATRTSITAATFNDTTQTGTLYNAVNGPTTPYYYPNSGSNDAYGGYTNWDAAIQQASSETPDKPELVLFVTDGDPTTYGNGSSRVTPFNPAALNPAMTAANTLKGTPTRMLAVGVGAGLTNVDSAGRLRNISGPKMTNEAGLAGKSINDFDVVAVPDFTTLATTLKTIVTTLCQSSVTVTKWVSQPGAVSPDPDTIPNGFVPASTPQWPFELTPTVADGGSYQWVLPAGGTMPVLTNGSGVAQFQWKPDPVTNDSTAAITETNQAGYRAGYAGGDDWNCKNQEGDSQSGELTDAGNNQWAFDKQVDVAATDIVTCNVFNEKAGTVSVNKEWVDGLAGDSFTLKILGEDGTPDLASGESTATGGNQTDTDVADTAIKVGDKFQVAEQAGSNTGSYDQSVTCEYGPQGEKTELEPVDGNYTMPDADVSCTFTNSRNAKTVSVNKEWVDGLAGDSFTLKILGEDGTPDLASGESTATGGNQTDTDVADTAIKVGDKFQVAEQAGSNTGSYDQSVTCEYGPQGEKTELEPVDGNYTMPDADVSCTFTNSRSQNLLTLQKQWGTNAVNGDKADLKIEGGQTDPATATATAPDGASTSTEVLSAAEVTVSEQLTGTGSYSSTLKCVRTDTTDEVAGSSDGVFAMPDYPVTCTYTNDLAAIKVTKSASETTVQPGTPVTYTYKVENTGDVTLDPVAVSDDKCAPVEGPAKTGDVIDGDDGNGKLDPGETWTYSCTVASLTEDTTNTVTATGTPPVGPPVTDTDTETVTVINPKIKVTKSASETTVQPGTPVTYTYKVENTGDVTLDPVAVSDDKCAPVEGPAKTGDVIDGDDGNGKLDPGETWTYSCTVASLTEDTTNTVTATGTPPVGPPVTDTDTETVTVINPKIKVTKKASETTVQPGTPVTYTYKVENTGDVTLDPVAVSDDKCAPVEGPAKTGDVIDGDDGNGKLDPGETWTYSCTVASLTEDTTNTVTATGTPPVGPPVTDTDTETVTVINPGIKVVKKASADQVVSGDTVTYTYTVTNPGDVTLDQVSVSDNKCSPVTYQSGDTNNDTKLQTTETWIFTCSTKLTETTENTAVVTGTPPVGPPVTDTDTVTVKVINPGIKVVKKASATQVSPGDTVTYTYTVTNTGDVTLDQVAVSDNKCSPVTYQSGDTNNDTKLQTTETWIFTCSTKLTETTENTAVVTGTPPVGPPVTDTDTVIVGVTQVSPVAAKRICPITVTLVKPKPTKVGNRVIVKKIKTKKSSCKLLKPVVLCRPLASNAAGEKAFCDTKVTKKGKIRVKTRGYDKVKVTVIVRAKPKKGYEDRYKPNTWRKTWILR